MLSLLPKPKAPGNSAQRCWILGNPIQSWTPNVEIWEKTTCPSVGYIILNMKKYKLREVSHLLKVTELTHDEAGI